MTWDYRAMVDTRAIEDSPETGVYDGLAYALWLPDAEPVGGLLILHGAGSNKESHFEYARAARSMGLAAIAFDQRGHGASAGRLGSGLLDDVAAIRALLTARMGDEKRPAVALRGSSMGGYVALQSAARDGADAVVAICPAGAEHLLLGLRREELGFDADAPALARFLSEHDLVEAVGQLDAALLLMHAEGDEDIPVEHSGELYAAARMPRKRLLTIPGGDHRSVQHDAELQAESLRFVLDAFAAGQPTGR